MVRCGVHPALSRLLRLYAGLPVEHYACIQSATSATTSLSHSPLPPTHANCVFGTYRAAGRGGVDEEWHGLFGGAGVGGG